MTGIEKVLVWVALLVASWVVALGIGYVLLWLLLRLMAAVGFG